MFRYSYKHKKFFVTNSKRYNFLIFCNVYTLPFSEDAIIFHYNLFNDKNKYYSLTSVLSSSACTESSFKNGLEISFIPSTGEIRITVVPRQTSNPSDLVSFKRCQSSQSKKEIYII